MQQFNGAIDRIESDHLIINTAYQEFLARIGFNTFESVYHYTRGDVIKRIKAKTVLRLEFNHQGAKRIFYLKRHGLEFIGFAGLWRRFLNRCGGSQGRLEFENICDFRKNNFATVVPVAAGEKVYRGLWVKSFLITEDFSPYISLEEMLAHQPRFFTGPEGVRRRRILLGEISRIARNMHQRGLNHLDFNATHILLHYENGSLPPKLALFDFQRVSRRRLLRFRWKIKSLARLNYSLPTEIFSEADRRHLFLSYLKKNKLANTDRLQWLWFKRKTARIKHHTDKILSRRKRMNP
jgi:hypothetical protein